MSNELERFVNSMPKNRAAHLLIRTALITKYLPIDARIWLCDVFSMVRLKDIIEEETKILREN